MRANEIRQRFLQFFEKRGHRIVKSSPLIPEGDPTLLFTNAGMNQFKNVFLGVDRRDYSRAATVQKCVRAGGKHNDLEMVGRTLRHHTFFEMLGNFSFGDYFKREAIAWAWELVTGDFGLPPEKLYITVFETDDEAFDIWNKEIGIPAERIFRCGEKENFWAMGDTGPCGPCSELHYDLGLSPLGHGNCLFPCDCGRYVEIWNLVFMQYDRDEEGNLTPLPRPSIDTGMGLERIAAVLQGKISNYDTDLFRPLIEEACELAGKEHGTDPQDDASLRIIADHSRATAFLITDGVLPGNEGRNYVLRKIIRRAARHGRRLGLEQPFLFHMTGLVAELMREPYPELIPARDYVARVVKNEEERFSTTLTQGLKLLDEICLKVAERGGSTIPGPDLFRLYDTFGFPLDLAAEIAAERGLAIDEAGFQSELEKQRERAKASWKAAEKRVPEVYLELSKHISSQFVGYETMEHRDSRVMAIVSGPQLLERAQARDEVEVVLDITPFYPEGGGQVGDKGTLSGETAVARVIDTYSPVTGITAHRCVIERGQLKVGDKVVAAVDVERRLATKRNHTGTHLLHAALREVLGEHVKQAGSLVAPDRLRFDFTHFAPLSMYEIERIEELVNQQIELDKPVSIHIMDLDLALNSGALAFFGDKYQGQVRVVSVDGFSKELCGGTHVAHTGEIGLLKIVEESSIAAGVRRVEAVTGENALKRLQDDEKILDQLGQMLKASRPGLVEAVERLQNSLKEALKEIESLRARLAEREARAFAAEVREVKGVKVLAQKVGEIDRAALRDLADRLRRKLGSGVIVLGAPQPEGKVALTVMVTPDLTARLHAGKIIKEVAARVGGGGGGKPELAEAGGRDPSRLDEALEASYRIVEQFLTP